MKKMIVQCEKGDQVVVKFMAGHPGVDIWLERSLSLGDGPCTFYVQGGAREDGYMPVKIYRNRVQVYPTKRTWSSPHSPGVQFVIKGVWEDDFREEYVCGEVDRLRIKLLRVRRTIQLSGHMDRERYRELVQEERVLRSAIKEILSYESAFL